MSTDTDTTTPAEDSATNGAHGPVKLGVLMIDPEASRRELIREIHERLFDVDEIATELRDQEWGRQLYRAQYEALALFETLVEWDTSEMEPRAQWALEEGS